jgi:hypothetical protein
VGFHLFQIAKDYCQATELCMGDEKMAVVIQEMVGKRHHDRFYPELSGWRARSTITR